VIKELWHNSFDGALGERPVIEALEFVNGLPAAELATTGVVASIAEGRRLAEDAAALGIAVNVEFAGLVLRADDGGVVVPCGDGLTLTVLGPAPGAARGVPQGLAGRSAPGAWDRRRDRRHRHEPAQPGQHRAARRERGTSHAARRGRARRPHPRRPRSGGLLSPGGTMHVDLFKLPHHGSCRNNTSELFTRVTADTYVISADGKHGNPDRETLERLAAARAGAPYTVACTFPEGADRLVRADDPGADERRAALRDFHAWAQEMSARGVTVKYRDPDAHSLPIVLGDERL
jgi:hypothetical protein